MNSLITYFDQKKLYRDVDKKRKLSYLSERQMLIQMNISRSTYHKFSKNKTITINTFLKILHWSEKDVSNYIINPLSKIPKVIQIKTKEKVVSLKDILDNLKKELENRFNLDNLFNKSTKRPYIRAREIFDYIAYEYLNCTSIYISNLTGRQHETVLNSKNKVVNLIELDKYKYTQLVNKLKSQIAS